MGKTTQWNLQVPIPMDEAVEKVVAVDTHSTKSEFIRDAVRKELRRLGIEPKIKVEVAT